MSTKIHAAVDALGNPVRFLLTPGQVHEMTKALPLIAGIKAEFLLADKAFDSDEFRSHLSDCNITAVIPSNRSRATPKAYDKVIYKDRHLVECFFAKVKRFRRIATRFEKTSKNYLAMIYVAAVIVLLA